MTTLRAPPRVPGPPIVGNALRIVRAPLGFTVAAARRYGDVVELGIPGLPIYLVSRPDLIERVLVGDHRSYIKDVTTRDLTELLGAGLLTSEGDLWRRQRRLAQPGFHRERVASYGEVMVRFALRALDAWADGEERDAHADMMQLTREIVAKTLFDADVGLEDRRTDEALRVVIQRFIDIPLGVPLLRKLPTPGKRRYDAAVAHLDAMLLRLVAERRASGRDPGDLLSMLMAARDEGGERMDDRQIRDEAMTLFLAGHETTANALSWTWALLSWNPAARARLHRELDEVLGGRPPTAADLPALRYAERVLLESMRLFPPAWAIGREAVAPTTLGEYHVPKGVQVWISQYVVHRDGRHYEAPDVFAPERWEGDRAKRLPRYAYFPFGGGPRLCIGGAFAMMEAVLLLATVAQRFRLDVIPGHAVEIEPSITLRPKRGVRVIARRR